MKIGKKASKYGAVKLLLILLLGLAVGLTLKAAGPTLGDFYTVVSLRVACDRCGSLHLNSFDADRIREPLCRRCRADLEEAIIRGAQNGKKISRSLSP